MLMLLKISDIFNNAQQMANIQRDFAYAITYSMRPNEELNISSQGVDFAYFLRPG